MEFHRLFNPMIRRPSRGLLMAVVLAGNLPARTGSAESGDAGKVSFNFEIRPILANTCFSCHGPDEKRRKGKLRLDVGTEAVAKGAVKPGDPAGSEVMKRLLAT